MDFGNASRPPAVSAASLVPRADVVSVQGGVTVDLPPEKTVQSAQAGDAVRVDIHQRQQDDAREKRALSLRQADVQREQARRDVDLNDVIERRLVIEPRTRSIVIQKRDRETGETVQLIPDEATLKLRIYARQLAERDRDAFAGRYVERTA